MTTSRARTQPDHAIGSKPEATLRSAGLRVEDIPRAAEASPTALRRLIDQERMPAVFQGLTDSWRARSAWQPDKLRQELGDLRVCALVELPSEGVLLPQDQVSYEQTMPLAEFIDIMATANAEAPCYLAYKRAAELFDPADYDFDTLLPGAGPGRDTRVWMGSADTRSMLHSDLKDNLFCQIYGQKSVVLLSWRDSRAAYPFPDNLVNSQVDIGRPDLERFPRLADVTFYQAVLEPGDVLFIPRGWWHDIRAVSPSISINHWFGPSQSAGRYLRLLAMSGPRYWLATARDLVVHGMLHRGEETRFFFSPPSTGKRLWEAIRRRGFSHDNDPGITD